MQVRLGIIQSFSEAEENLLQHLAHAEILELALMALNDESFDVQQASVSLMARLSRLNPPAVLPRFRQLLMETLSQLSNSGVSKLELQSARLISRICSCGPRFIRPYMDALLTALLVKLHDETTREEVSSVPRDFCLGDCKRIGSSE